MRQNVRIITILTAAVILLYSCKIDNSENIANEDPETSYYRDYESAERKWGFIDTSGNRVIDARFDLVSAFSEGLAPVNFEGKWGYIDKAGEVVIPYQYRAAWQFHQGIARVLNFDGTPCLIYPDARTICPPDVSEIGDFSEGLAVYELAGLYGYLDTTGSKVISPQFQKAWNFEEGFARVTLRDQQGLINKSGEFVIKPEYSRVYTPSDNLILVKSEGTYRFLNMSGDRVSRDFTAGTPFVEGVAAVGDKSGWYLIDLQYQPLFDARYSFIRPAGAGFWVAKQADRWAVLDHNGNALTLFQYKQINNFSEGLAGYLRDMYWGFIDTTGTELTPPQFGLVWDFHNGLARAAFRDGIAFINTDAKIPFQPDYSDANDFNGGLAPFQE
jgi:hypothetical protein